MSIDVSRCLSATEAVVDFLVKRAEAVADRESLSLARPLFEAAIACDPTPGSRIAYAVELAKIRPEAAVSQLKLACDDACRNNHSGLRAHCCRSLALILARMGDRIGAEQYRQLAIAAEMEAAAITATASQALFSPALLCDLAADWISSGDVDSAEVLLQSAQSLARESNLEQRAIIATLQGVIAAMRLQAEAAIEHLVRAYRRLREGGEPLGIAHALVNLGHLVQACGQYAGARNCFDRAARLYAHAGEYQQSQSATAYERETVARDRLKRTQSLWN